MPNRGSFLALIALLASTANATAQQPEKKLDSTRAQIHTTLRAFYFNLAHRDWEALTADILAAKVVAHRPAPESLVAAASRPRAQSPGRAGLSLAGNPAACPLGGAALVEQAKIALDGDWAHVSVPHCPALSSGADEFRLIHFEERWRMVYIDLFPESVNRSTER
jgi:hypothetical protein